MPIGSRFSPHSARKDFVTQQDYPVTQQDHPVTQQDHTLSRSTITPSFPPPSRHSREGGNPAAAASLVATPELNPAN